MAENYANTMDDFIKFDPKIIKLFFGEPSKSKKGFFNFSLDCIVDGDFLLPNEIAS